MIGIDASAAMIAEARRRGSAGGVDFRVGDAARLGLPDASVDGARAERTLQHLDRPQAAVAELTRVVRPGGRVVVAEPDWGTLVLDPGDPETTREVVRAAVERVRSGTVGRALRGHLMRAGLTEVDVVARVLVVPDADAARVVFDIDGALARAIGTGRVSHAAAERWRAEMSEAAAGGTHLAAMTAFMAWGRVPA